MNIKLNNQNFIIKTSDNLTVKEYIDLSKLDQVNIINYISTTLNVEFAQIADLKFNEKDLKIISSYIGNLKPFEYFEKNKSDNFYFGYTGQTFYPKNVLWETVGTRMLMENRKSDNAVELAIYLLAITVSKNYDAELIEANYNRLLNTNYIQALSFITFFFMNFKNGLSKGQRFSRLQMLEFIQNIRKKLRKSKTAD